jgi:hypothetical protein
MLKIYEKILCYFIGPAILILIGYLAIMLFVYVIARQIGQ